MGDSSLASELNWLPFLVVILKHELLKMEGLRVGQQLVQAFAHEEWHCQLRLSLP